jgi:uncharacterized beta-barrel protein YwiB (DUF1934 family)
MKLKLTNQHGMVMQLPAAEDITFKKEELFRRDPQKLTEAFQYRETVEVLLNLSGIEFVFVILEVFTRSGGETQMTLEFEPGATQTEGVSMVFTNVELMVPSNIHAGQPEDNTKVKFSYSTYTVRNGVDKSEMVCIAEYLQSVWDEWGNL